MVPDPLKNLPGDGWSAGRHSRGVQAGLGERRRRYQDGPLAALQFSLGRQMGRNSAAGAVVGAAAGAVAGAASAEGCENKIKRPRRKQATGGAVNASAPVLGVGEQWLSRVETVSVDMGAAAVARAIATTTTAGVYQWK